MKHNPLKTLLLSIIILSSGITLNAAEKAPKAIKAGATYKVIFAPMVSETFTIMEIDKSSGWIKVKTHKKGVKEEWINLNQAIAIQLLKEKKSDAKPEIEK